MLQQWLVLKKTKSVGSMGVMMDPTGSSNIGFRRTHCDSGGNMTLGTHRGMEEHAAGSRKAMHK